MKVLLVGGTGVLSTEIMNQLVSLRHEVFILNRGKRKKVIPKTVTQIITDINDLDRVQDLIQNIFFDVIIDFISYTPSQITARLPIYKDHCNQFVFISSCAVYNKGKGNYVCSENSPLVNPVWTYSVNKVNCENKVVSLCKKFGIKYTIIRPAVTYDNTRIPYGIMPRYGLHWTIVSRILHKKPILIWDNGENISTITRVEDFSKGAVALFDNSKAYNQVFNIVGDERYSWKDVIETLGEILNTKPIYANVPKEYLANKMPSKKGEILGGRGINQLVDNSKIKSIVPNFKTISLKDGIDKTIKYYKNNNYLDGIDYKFDAEIDRIIYKYYSMNNKEQLKKFNLKYIDYLKDKKISDKITYYLIRYKGSFFLSILLKVRRKINAFN